MKGDGSVPVWKMILWYTSGSPLFFLVKMWYTERQSYWMESFNKSRGKGR